MGLLEWLIGKWQTSRLFCHFCHHGFVATPGTFCSAQCEDWGTLEDLAA